MENALAQQQGDFDFARGKGYPRTRDSRATQEAQPAPAVPVRLAMSLLDQIHKLELKDILQLVAVVGLGLSFLLTRISNESVTQTNIAALTQNVSQLSADVKAINNLGLQAQIAEDQRRIGQLEQQMTQLLPKMSEVQTKLDIIATMLDKQSKR